LGKRAAAIIYAAADTIEANRAIPWAVVGMKPWLALRDRLVIVKQGQRCPRNLTEPEPFS
jgi:hypothetical protein